MGFFTGFLGGAFIAGTYTLLTNKRTGPENMKCTIHYLEDVRDGLTTFQQAKDQVSMQLHNVLQELELAKIVLAPGIEKDAEQLATEADYHTRRINQDIEAIDQQITTMHAAIKEEHEA
ncbi:hypothetical protein [Allofustis seminis]|uniref:hypothetical protein n=1 Tax=Allofustis seminis TaxID=166939 RepID=UPI000364DACE|nr:hypothetical protein [Allofustis seminis]